MKNRKYLFAAILLVCALALSGCSCANRGASGNADVTQAAQTGTPAAAEPTAAGTDITAEPTPAAGTDITAKPTPAAGTDITAEPTAAAGTGITAEPTPAAGTDITAEPTSAAGTDITAGPTADPGADITAAPVPSPDVTAAPTAVPTAVPTAAPTAIPTAAPIAVPTAAPTAAPTSAPPKDTVSAGLACPSQNGALQVSGTQLVDENGNPVQLRGASTHGIAWFPSYVNQALFTEMHSSWNANVVRLAMYTDEYGGYCSGGDKDKLKKLVKNGVKYATEADMYVIIDWHILNDRDQIKYIDDAKAFFKERSEEFGSYNNVIYELCNEPNGSTSWSDIKSYAEVIIPIIRQSAPDAVIIVGTTNWSQYVDKAAADPITGEKNIMYALHFYAATHKDDLRNKLKNAVGKGLPIFVTEYGICDASGNGSIDKDSAKKWVDLMDSLGVSYVCWNLSNKNETSALFKSSCSKTSGFTADDMSDEGKWLLEILAGTAGPSGSENGSDDNSGTGSGSDDHSGTETGSDDHSGTTGISGADSVLPASGSTGGIAWELSCSNSWESEGRTFYQYDVKITNNGSSAVDSWSVTIAANGKISVSNIWCAKYELSGNALTLTNESYNGQIGPGASRTDVGIIIAAE